MHSQKVFNAYAEKFQFNYYRLWERLPAAIYSIWLHNRGWKPLPQTEIVYVVAIMLFFKAPQKFLL